MPSPLDLNTIASRMDALLQRQKELKSGPPVARFTSVDFNPYVEGTDAWRFHQDRLDKQNAIIQAHEELERDFRQFIGELGDIYLSTDVETARSIRQLVAARKDFHLKVLDYHLTAPDRISRASDMHHFRRGLAALSIEDDLFDSRDTTLSIERLFFAAQEIGIDPRPHFAEVAAKSNHVSGNSSFTPLGKRLDKIAKAGIGHYCCGGADLERIRFRIRKARQSTE